MTEIDLGGVSDLCRCPFADPGDPDNPAKTVVLTFDLFQTARLIRLLQEQHPMPSESGDNSNPIADHTALGERCEAYQQLIDEIAKGQDKTVPRQTERRLIQFADRVVAASFMVEHEADKKKAEVVAVLKGLLAKSSNTETPAAAASITAMSPTGPSGAESSGGD